MSKTGTKDFHGSVYGYKRHEQFNANDFFNNRNNLPKPLYRFTTVGGGVGGPIYIPGRFNPDKNKLFFFYSQEDWRVRTPAARRQFTVPTQLERRGDFSQTLDQAGRLIAIRDPLSGASFPGNVVPASRVNPNGPVLLSLNPMPNVLDRNISKGAYNFEFQENIRMPKRLQLLVLDYRPTKSDVISVTPRRMWVDNKTGQPVLPQMAKSAIATEEKFDLSNMLAAVCRISGETTPVPSGGARNSPQGERRD